MERPAQTTPAVVTNEGRLEIQVPNKRIARLIQLGIASERAQRRKAVRRRMERQARRRNRSK